MKKLIIALMLLLASTTTCFAEGIQQFYYLSGRDTDIIQEINYYLSKGAKVEKLITVARNSGDGVGISMVIEIPTDVFNNEKYKK